MDCKNQNMFGSQMRFNQNPVIENMGGIINNINLNNEEINQSFLSLGGFQVPINQNVRNGIFTGSNSAESILRKGKVSLENGKNIHDIYQMNMQTEQENWELENK